MANYQIQKSFDASNWQNTGAPITARNISGIQQYSYTDLIANSPLTYYRVRQMSMDGQTSYSSIVFVKNEEGNSLSLYPNPTGKYLFISTGNGNVKLRSMRVFTISGQEVKILPLQNPRQYSLDVSHFTAGPYKLLIEFTDGSMQTHSFIKL